MSREEISFEGLSSTDFEQFCFELLRELGFVNVDWRKGSNTEASPADRGRDIVAELERTDVDGARHMETWFVDCKHHEKAIPPTELQGLLAWAHAERPHTALVIASGFLSNPAKDYVNDYEQNNRPPFRVKYWERPILDRLTEGKHALLSSYLLTSDLRSETAIVEAESEFFDRVWLDRHMLLDEPETGREPAERIRAQLGEDNVGPYSEFEWGMINGKLSALRWVLGADWDFLDT